jgi:hypothetical protein
MPYLIKKGLVNLLLGKLLEKGKLISPTKQTLPEHTKAFILFTHENYNKQLSLSFVAKNISEGLFRNAVCAKVDGGLVDLSKVIEKACKQNTLHYF